MYSLITGIRYYAYMGVVSYFDYFEDTNISCLFFRWTFEPEISQSDISLFTDSR